MPRLVQEAHRTLGATGPSLSQAVQLPGNVPGGACRKGSVRFGRDSAGRAMLDGEKKRANDLSQPALTPLPEATELRRDYVHGFGSLPVAGNCEQWPTRREATPLSPRTTGVLSHPWPLCHVTALPITKPRPVVPPKTKGQRLPGLSERERGLEPATSTVGSRGEGGDQGFGGVRSVRRTVSE